MRPKFRAWDKRFSEFVEDFFVSEDGKIYKKTKDTGYGIAISRETSDKVILMQSTGLFDKNNKEIFEGDVVRQVRTQPTTKNETITGVVTMIEGAWLIMNDYEQLASDLWSETDENEIIGNIYENKDILEVINEKRK